MEYFGVLPRKLREKNESNKSNRSTPPPSSSKQSVSDTNEFERIRHRWSKASRKGSATAIPLPEALRSNPVSMPKNVTRARLSKSEEGDDVSEDIERQMQELHFVTSHLTELGDKKKKLQSEAKRAQEALKKVEWEHRMGEATTSWYQLRFEERKAAKQVKREEEKLRRQQMAVEKAHTQWNDLKNAVQKATQIAQQLHNEAPDNA